MSTKPSRDLVPLDNPAPQNRYRVEISTPEFTCVCPVTGQPDFATIRISYEPAAKIVELKSVKLYLWAFRNEGHYHEAVVNRILGDLVDALQPHYMCVEGEFNVRGGVYTTVRAEHGSPKA